MPDPSHCPKCGAELPADATEGLCPKCLLQVGLDDSQFSGPNAGESGSSAPTNAASEPPPLGTKVRYVGDYELLEEIARGGMGVVYKARQLSLNRTVALKMILAGQLAGEADLQRFHTEAEAAANLQHPNIVAIHEVGEHEGHHYFSMDFVDGRSLKEIVREHPIQSQQAARYLQTIARAIHYAHGQGTLHRDLKPSNVVIDENDQPQITDFGLAKRFETDADLTGTGQILGTPGYLPPEQAGAKYAEVGPASDVYSLGAVLYELLTGRPPFRAETPLETIRQVLEAEPAAPRLLNPRIPRDLETICLKCLQKSPRDRYKSAEGLAEDLGRFLNDEPIRARPIGRIDRARRRIRKLRRSSKLIAGTVALTLLIVLGGFFGWKGYRYVNQGDLILETDGPPATVEILDADDRLVVPPFTAPNAEPVQIPAGAHRLRLSAPGFIDETYQLLIDRGGEHRFQFDLREQLMWPPIEVGYGEHAAVVQMDGHLDLIHLTKQGIRRIDGFSGETMWETAINAATHPALESTEWLRWPNMSKGNSPPDIVDVPPSGADLDGDGMDDFVVYANRSNSVLAVSGKDGHVLWAWQKQPTAEQKNQHTNGRLERYDLVLYPTFADVDADDLADVIVGYKARSLQSNSGLVLTSPSSLEAISGRTGERLWRRPFELGYSSEAVVVPEGLLIKSKIENSDSRQVLLDLGTGDENWEAARAFRNDREDEQLPEHDGILGPDLNGDGVAEQFVIHCDRASGSENQPTYLKLQAISGANGEVVWSNEHELPNYLSFRTYDKPRVEPAWFQVGPDGWPQLLVVLRSKQSDSYSRPYKGDVAFLISAADGRIVHTIDDVGDVKLADFNGDNLPDLYWLGRSTASSSTIRGEFRVLRGIPPAVWRRLEAWIATEDLDGDGVRDLISESALGSHNPRPVSALSGKDGTVLWRSSLQYDFVYSAPPPLGDLDGDDVSDLVFGSDREPVLNESLGGWTKPLIAVSGKTGRTLWSHDVLSVSDTFVEFHDFDSDGRTEVVFQNDRQEYVEEQGGHRLTGKYVGVKVVRGRDGTVKWETEWPVDRDWTRLVLAAVVDLDGDGTLDSIVTDFQSSSKWAKKHYALRGTDGSQLWERSFSGQLIAAEVEGDSQPEILVINQQKDSPPSLHVIGGKTGETIWTYDRQHGRYDIDEGLAAKQADYDESLLKLLLNGPPVELDGHRKPRQLTDNLWLFNRVGDLTGDGQRELLYTVSLLPIFRPNRPLRHRRTDRCPVFDDEDWFYSLRAANIDDRKVLWEWPFPYGWGEIVDLMPGTSSDDPTVVVWTNNRLYGLSGSTGIPRWRSEAQQSFQYLPQYEDNGSIMREVSSHYEKLGGKMLNPYGVGDLPLVAWTRFSKNKRAAGTNCRLALPTDADGEYLSPLDAVRRLHPAQGDASPKETDSPRNESSREATLVRFVREFPVVDAFKQELAMVYTDRCYEQALAGQIEKAKAAQRQAIEVWETIADHYEFRAEQTPRHGREINRDDARYQNGRAWFLVSCPLPRLRDADSAVKLAESAVEQGPQNAKYWNTLGAAQVRAGQSEQAIESLNKSLELQGDNGHDFFFLAMAYRQLGQQQKAKDFFQRAINWTDKNDPQDEELRRFRAEAALIVYAVADAPHENPAPKPVDGIN